MAPLLGTAGRALDPADGREAVGCRIHADLEEEEVYLTAYNK